LYVFFVIIHMYYLQFVSYKPLFWYKPNCQSALQTRHVYKLTQLSEALHLSIACARYRTLLVLTHLSKSNLLGLVRFLSLLKVP